MIITADEYRAMGFTAKDDAALENSLLRAEYTIAGLTEGRYEAALAAGGKAAEYVKQAAGFQTYKLVREHEAGFSGISEKVSVGDFSYSTASEAQAASADDTFFDMSMQTIRLLKAAGCLFGGREVAG